MREYDGGGVAFGHSFLLIAIKEERLDFFYVIRVFSVTIVHVGYSFIKPSLQAVETRVPLQYYQLDGDGPCLPSVDGVVWAHLITYFRVIIFSPYMSSTLRSILEID